jgi:hypothetical protein
LVPISLGTKGLFIFGNDAFVAGIDDRDLGGRRDVEVLREAPLIVALGV